MPKMRIIAVLLCGLVSLTNAGIARPAEAPSLRELAQATEPMRLAVPAGAAEKLPLAKIAVDAADDEGPLELWRHSVGHGGINSSPLPDRVVEATARLRPRLIRIFIQEFFFVYPEHGTFDWKRLDRYLESFERTGAKVVAAITIKPRPLFPRIDPEVWRPNDPKEWQRVLAAMVKRYSVDKPLITHWEIGNETDIGESGGCPFLIREPKDYLEFYKLSIEPILATFPKAKVGGCAVANAGSDYLPRFIELCRRQSVRLDFVSWHHYHDDSTAHAGLVERYRKLLEPFGKERPEMMVTEWNKSFEPVSVEEMAFEPRRAALTAAAILAMNDARVDWSFYYHLWDQTCKFEEFKPFFRDPNFMPHYWNEVPIRFGLFGVNQEVRPQYFVYAMLGKMAGRRVRTTCDAGELRVLGSVSEHRAVRTLIVNCDRATSRDRICQIRFAGLKPGSRQFTVCRIDRGHSWSPRTLELVPTETREVDVNNEFTAQVFTPADSVTLVALEPTPSSTLLKN